MPVSRSLFQPVPVHVLSVVELSDEDLFVELVGALDFICGDFEYGFN
jgi:hypothetical protein